MAKQFNVLMLGTPRARSNGPAFIAGWTLGLATVGTVVCSPRAAQKQARAPAAGLGERAQARAWGAAPAGGGEAVARAAPARRTGCDSEMDDDHRHAATT